MVGDNRREYAVSKIKIARTLIILEFNMFTLKEIFDLGAVSSGIIS
jgi:hypothetical protein